MDPEDTSSTRLDTIIIASGIQFSASIVGSMGGPLDFELGDNDDDVDRDEGRDVTKPDMKGKAAADSLMIGLPIEG